MALSQMEQQQQEQILGQGYTHKKFNCGYSHKKLGRRFRQREPVNIENTSQPQTEQIKIAKHSKDIFRPYALDESNTTRKRKVSSSTDEESVEKNCTTSPKTAPTSPNTNNEPQNIRQPKNEPSHIVAPHSYPLPLTSLESCYFPALSPNSYNMSLQSQRAALYMRYMAQVQSEKFAANLQATMNYSMGYPNVMPLIFNGC